MQIFAHEPTDGELATLVDPIGRSLWAKIEATDGVLAVHPRGTPMWFVLTCLTVPSICFVAVMIYLIVHGVRDPFFVFGAVFGFVAIPANYVIAIAIFNYLNRQMTARGSFFVLKMPERTLQLPRENATIAESQIERFVEVHAWHRTGDEHNNIEALAELTVLIRDDNRQLRRYSMIACIHRSKVTQVGRQLSEFFGKDVQKFKLLWKTKKRLIREGLLNPALPPLEEMQ